MEEVSVKLKGRQSSVKFMFELEILYVIFNMATSNINKMSKYTQKKKRSPFVFNKKLV